MITEDTAWLLVEACRLLDKPIRGLAVCDLGNQYPMIGIGVPLRTIMRWFGADYTSIDLNGRDGALVYDLSQPIVSEALCGRFDLVTNAGTTEHVCTSGDFRDQWQAFRNMHELAKPTAAMMHVIPNERGAHGGCGYVYREEFLPNLAAACGYRLVEFYDSKSDHEHMAALMLKGPDNRFVGVEEFSGLGIITI